MGLGKLQQHAKFEVATFSRYTNIKGEPQNLGSSSSPWLRPLFLCGILWWILAKFQRRANFEVAGFSRCRNIVRNPKILGSFPSPRAHTIFPILL